MSLWLVSDLPAVREGRGCSGEAPLSDSAAFAASAGERPRPTLRQPRLTEGPGAASQGWSCSWTVPRARPPLPHALINDPSGAGWTHAGSSGARRCGQQVSLPPACCLPWHSHSLACCREPGPGVPSSGHRHKEKGDPVCAMGPQGWLIPWISLQALPRPALVPVPRVRRDVVMQEARTGAFGSSLSQLAPPPVAVHTNEEPHPIPSLVSSCLADVSGCLGTAPSSGREAPGGWAARGAASRRTRSGVCGGAGACGAGGGRRQGCESPLLLWVSARCRRGRSRGTGTQRLEVCLCRHWGLRAAVLSQRFVPAGTRQDREGAGGV